MSDVAPGPGWWKASDGNWYPPQPVVLPPPPPGAPSPVAAPAAAAAPAKSGKGCLIAVLIVFGLFALVAVVAFVAIAVLANKAEDKLDDVGSALSTPEMVDPSNPDARDGDEVKNLGDDVRVSGFTATVESANFRSEVEGLPPGEYLVVDVTLENRDDVPQGYIPNIEWTLQTPGRAVLPPVSPGTTLGSTLDSGDKVDLKVVFLVDGTKGQYFVLFRPDILGVTRGVWPVNR